MFPLIFSLRRKFDTIVSLSLAKKLGKSLFGLLNTFSVRS